MIFAMESQDSGYVQSLKKGMIKVLSAVSWRLLLYLLITYLGCSTCLGESLLPNQVSGLWKHGVLTTGPLGNSC